MNVYDFDDTIYFGDSTVDFYKFCLKKKPHIFLRFPFFTGAMFRLGIYEKVVFKERFYGFLKSFDNIDELVEEFWDVHIKNIKQWYLKRQKPDDVIISASPEFLLRPVCKRLGISNLMASVVDKKTGKYTGENCWGEEKVKRYRQAYNNTVIEEFYSDSLSDEPLALISEKAYVITDEKVEEWDKYDMGRLKKTMKMLLSPQFLLFVLIGVVNTVDCILFSALFELFISPNVAFVAGYLASLFVGYVLNSKVNFKEKLSAGIFAKYAVSYIPNFIIQNVIVFVVYNLMKLPAIAAYILAAVIGLPITFLCVKLFAFGQKKSS